VISCPRNNNDHVNHKVLSKTEKEMRAMENFKIKKRHFPMEFQAIYTHFREL
jgi:hypothetical protein